MKKTAAILLALCMLAASASALALEITEEHFPGYYVELHSLRKDVSKALQEVKMYGGSAPLFGIEPELADGGIMLDRRKLSAERGEIRSIVIFLKESNTSRGSVIGSFYWIKVGEDKISEVMDENLEWLDNHFGPSAVGDGRYLCMLGEDLVEVSVQQPRYNHDGSIYFNMALIEDADQALTAFGYQSLDEVPVAPWTPIELF